MANDRISSVAVLIDADNISAAAVEAAFEHLTRSEALVSVRRAYGGHEKLAGLKDVLKRHAIRAFVNQGKGTTDVALVVDAMDLLHRAAMPTVVAIASSDADFAPLAVRLREAGMRVLCFAQRDKAALDDLPRAYDDVIYVDELPHVEKPVPAASVPKPPAGQSLSSAKEVIAAAPVPAREDSEVVRRILAALPQWLPETVKQLNQLGAPLRESGIKKGNKPLHELFRKYPNYFKVLPMTGQAKQVRLLRKP